MRPFTDPGDSSHAATRQLPRAARSHPHAVRRREGLLDHLGDQWGAECGPWATTGHLRGWDRTPFTIGVNPTGELFVRNDQLGDALPLPVKPTDDLDTIARAVAEIIGHLY